MRRGKGGQELGGCGGDVGFVDVGVDVRGGVVVGVTCVAMNLLLCSSGVYYMDTIADSLQGGGTVILWMPMQL